MSTRLTTEQKELIDRAAQTLGWSASKLIRDSAIRRAIDIVNASEEAELQLRALAQTFVEQVVRPRARVTVCDYASGIPNGAPDSYSEEITAADGVYQPTDEHSTLAIRDVCVMRPDWNARAQIKDALQAAGSRFVEMMLSAWEVVEAGKVQFKPKINSANVLNESGDTSER